MNLKLDENIGAAGAELLRAAGHDVATVPEEHLDGISDDFLLDVCIQERRSLITLDRGFARLLRFSNPIEIGIAVLDIRHRSGIARSLNAPANCACFSADRSRRSNLDSGIRSRADARNENS